VKIKPSSTSYADDLLSASDYDAYTAEAGS
jgi:hypothetical protein